MSDVERVREALRPKDWISRPAVWRTPSEAELAFIRIERALRGAKEALEEIYGGMDVDQFGVGYYKAGERARKIARAALPAVVAALEEETEGTKLHILTSDDSTNEPPDIKVNDDFEI